jgi:hypothetical protein
MHSGPWTNYQSDLFCEACARKPGRISLMKANLEKEKNILRWTECNGKVLVALGSRPQTLLQTVFLWLVIVKGNRYYDN